MQENDASRTSVESVAHTPGPWREHAPRIDDQVDREYRSILGGSGLRGSGFELTGFISEADAKLIAAAPDMLTALLRIRSHLARVNSPFVVEAECSYLSEAINLAIGKPNTMDDDDERCECHERDSSYVCKYCYARGERGHMQR